MLPTNLKEYVSSKLIKMHRNTQPIKLKCLWNLDDIIAIWFCNFSERARHMCLLHNIQPISDEY